MDVDFPDIRVAADGDNSVAAWFWHEQLFVPGEVCLDLDVRFFYSTKNGHFYQVELLQSNTDMLQMCSRVDLLMSSLVSPVTIGKKLLM